MKTIIEKTDQPLKDVMESDHVIVVTADYRVLDAVGVYSPESLRIGYDGDDDMPSILKEHEDSLTGELDRQGWSWVNGYSGQQGYSGPLMHESEFIGGGMEKEIRSTPGLYVKVQVYLDRDDEKYSGNWAGWAVLYREQKDED